MAGGRPDGGADFAARVAAWLARRRAPAGSRAIAELFLRAAMPSEETATRLLRPSLEAAGLGYREGAGWLPPEQVPSGRTATDRIAAAVVDPRGGEPVLVEAGGEEAGAPPRVEAAYLDGATVVVLHAQEARILRAWMFSRGLPRPGSLVTLRGALRGTVRIPRDADLDRIAGLMGARRLQSDDAEGTARTMAACLARARRMRQERGAAGAVDPAPSGAAARVAGDPRGAPGDAAGVEGAPAKRASPPAAPPGSITTAQIAALPDGPGVYRFFDAEGGLLYVGKARNLRRRVSSYFSGRRAGRHGARFLARAQRLEHEPLGSELEALLEEARLIQRGAPKGNVQVQVHERAPAYAPARRFALLLPHGDGRRVTAVIVRDGRYVGLVSIGPKGGGLASARRLLSRALSGRAPRAGSAGEDRDTRILRTWLARRGETACRLDLDGFTSAAEASRALAEAVRVLLAEPEAIVFR